MKNIFRRKKMKAKIIPVIKMVEKINTYTSH